MLFTTRPVAGSTVTPGTLAYPPDVMSSCVGYANFLNPSPALPILPPCDFMEVNIFLISISAAANNSLMCFAGVPASVKRLLVSLSVFVICSAYGITS